MHPDRSIGGISSCAMNRRRAKLEKGDAQAGRTAMDGQLPAKADQQAISK